MASRRPPPTPPFSGEDARIASRGRWRNVKTGGRRYKKHEEEGHEHAETNEKVLLRRSSDISEDRLCRLSSADRDKAHKRARRGVRVDSTWDAQSRRGRRPPHADAAKTDMDTVVRLLLSSVHGRQVPGRLFLFFFLLRPLFFFFFPDSKVYHITPLRDETLH